MTSKTEDEASFLLATSAMDNHTVVHILVFRAPSEVGTWDVAYCSLGLGDYLPVTFYPEGEPLSNMCGRCFEMIGSHRATLNCMAAG